MPSNPLLLMMRTRPSQLRASKPCYEPKLVPIYYKSPGSQPLSTRGRKIDALKVRDAVDRSLVLSQQPSDYFELL